MKRFSPLSAGLQGWQRGLVSGSARLLGWRSPERPDVRLREKIMITILRSRFRSRDAAFAAAKKLSDLDPAHDCEAWPYRGYWVLVMRYRDDDGHILFKFVGPEDRLSNNHNIQAYLSATESRAARSSGSRAQDRDSTGP